jgi:hypothetical protein
MPPSAPPFSPDDWLRIRDALRYVGRDLHHRSFAVTDHRRRLLWEEMDRCLALADRIEAAGLSTAAGAEAALENAGVEQDTAAADRAQGSAAAGG